MQLVMKNNRLKQFSHISAARDFGCEYLNCWCSYL